MSQKITQDDGTEVEVFTADEVAAQVTAAAKAKEDEFLPKLTQTETERDEARKALGERAGEFAQFRKLSDEAVAKLGVAERTIYENGLALQEAQEKNKKLESEKAQAMVDSALKAKAGNDTKLFDKMKELWNVIGVEATTPEQIEQKTLMVLGAIGTTQPDLLASVQGFQGGSYTPPVEKKEGETSFADTEAGKTGAAELGLTLEVPKK